MREHHLIVSQTIPAPLERVFAFYADAANLEAITPPYLKFRITSPQPITMRPGVLIDYSLSLHGIPFSWRTEITDWEPGVRFVDRQVKGPYKQWIHEHTFRPDPVDPARTIVNDHVRYAIYGGVLAEPVHKVFVRPRLDAIFAYRQTATPGLITAG